MSLHFILLTLHRHLLLYVRYSDDCRVYGRKKGVFSLDLKILSVFPGGSHGQWPVKVVWKEKLEKECHLKESIKVKVFHTLSERMLTFFHDSINVVVLQS